MNLSQYSFDILPLPNIKLKYLQGKRREIHWFVITDKKIFTCTYLSIT